MDEIVNMAQAVKEETVAQDVMVPEAEDTAVFQDVVVSDVDDIAVVENLVVPDTEDTAVAEAEALVLVSQTITQQQSIAAITTITDVDVVMHKAKDVAGAEFSPNNDQTTTIAASPVAVSYSNDKNRGETIPQVDTVLLTKAGGNEDHNCPAD